MSSAAREYRQLAAQFASPVGLVGQAYDQIIRAIYLAAQAVGQRNIEVKTKELNRALAIVGHLESALDRNISPEVAARLALFYSTMRHAILRASTQFSADDLHQIARHFSTMREAWAVVEREVPALPVPEST